MSLPILEISRSGMDVEYKRVEVIAQNIANATTTRTAEGKPFMPSKLVSGPAVSTQKPGVSAVRQALGGVQVYGIEEVAVQPRLVYEPSHPHADAKGYVAYPGIDHVGEMTSLMTALRTYDANVAVFNATRSMYLKALEMGGRQ